MDQVTLIGPQDLASLPFHIRYTRAHLPFIERTFYIVPATETFQAQLHAILAHVPASIADRAVFIAEDTVCSPQVCENKWIYQQLVKLSVHTLQASHGLSTLFLFTDVDTICLRPLSEPALRLEGRPVFWAAHYQSKGSFQGYDFSQIKDITQIPNLQQQTVSWLLAFSWTALNLLGIKTMPCVSAVNACVLWDCVVLRALHGFIENQYKKPLHEAVLACFRSFIREHRSHFYTYEGFRGVLMTYYPYAGLTPVSFDEALLFKTLRVGFSEWQLYLFFLSITKHNYCFLFQPPNTSRFIAECNLEVNGIKALKKVVQGSENELFPYYFINFYPSITADVADVLRAHVPV